MIDKKFRKMMIEHPDIVRNSMLSNRQIEIAKLVHRLPTPIYSTDIADRLGISIQNASSQMAKLAKAGYVTRHKVVAPSGGLEYQYLPVLV